MGIGSLHMVQTFQCENMPKPILVELNGKFYARWTHDDEIMRSRNRSVLERLDRICSVDDAFLDALRSDDAEVKWASREDIVDFGRRIAAWHVDFVPDPSECAKVGFRLSVPEIKPDGRRRRDLPEEQPWRLEAVLPPNDGAALRTLGFACRAYAPLRGMTGRSMELEQSEVETLLRVGSQGGRISGADTGRA